MALPTRKNLPAKVATPIVEEIPDVKLEILEPAATLAKKAKVTTPSSLILGDTGNGKTFPLATYALAGIELFVIITEPNGLDSLLDAFNYYRLPLDKLHYKVISPAAASIATLLKKARVVNTKSAGEIQKMEVGLDRSSYKQYGHFLESIQNFVCDRTGESYGDVTEWDDTRAFAVDSLTGLNMIVTQWTCGNRPTLTQPEYGLVQNTQRDLLNVLTSLDCYFTLTAHIENNYDEIAGSRRAFPLSVGKALGPEIPRFFSEVVLARREETKFFWSTNDDRAVVKRRALQAGSTLKPDFGQLVTAHNKRKEEVYKKIAS